MIDILVLNYNDAPTTIRFVNSVKDFSCVRYILVVDNHSTDESRTVLKKIQNEKIIVVDSGKNGGYGFGNNYGIKLLQSEYNSEYILLSNPDVVVEESVLVELEIFLRNNNEYAIAAPFMLDTKGEKQFNTAFRIPSKWEYIFSIDLLISKLKGSFYYKNIEKETSEVIDVGAVTGSMFFMRVKDITECEMYDENVFLYCEELILGKRLASIGKKIALLTRISFVHNHSVSISKTYKTLFSKQRLLMQSKMYVIKHYYDANLFDYFIAWLFFKLSFFEVFLIGVIKRL